jgi:hypothetical protein
MHAKGFDPKDNGLAVTLTDTVRCCFIGGQVYLLARLRLQTL